MLPAMVSVWIGDEGVAVGCEEKVSKRCGGNQSKLLEDNNMIILELGRG